ncbi:hypothetical protein OAE88_00775 [bacterium]|nr:hypothetical protein [bacterium]
MDQLKLMSKQGSTDSKGGGYDKSLYRFNDLVYEQVRNSSLIAARHLERFNSQSLNYSNQSSSIDFVFQSGEQLLDGSNSCIQFDLTVSTPTVVSTGPPIVVPKWGFSTGSAMNLFKTCILHSRQGDEIDRLNSANIYRANRDLHESKTWFETAGSLMGYQSDDTATPYTTGTSYFFQIPLDRILNVFGTGRLMPSQMVSGARLQMDIEKAAKRLFKFDATSADVTFTLSNVRMVCALSRPTDDTARTLEKQSASNSLEFSWEGVYTQKRAVTGEINEQVSKSVARALCVRVVPLKDPANNTELFMTPHAVGYADAQIRAGSLYMPQYRLTDSEIYHATLQAVDKLGKSVRYSKSDSDAKADVWATSLESHNLINFAGQSLNNSRQLYVETTISPAITAGEGFIFLDYLKTSRCYLNSIAVDQ